jgi:hypothetical protein
MNWRGQSLYRNLLRPKEEYRGKTKTKQSKQQKRKTKQASPQETKKETKKMKSKSLPSFGSMQETEARQLALFYAAAKTTP